MLTETDLKTYQEIRARRAGFYEQKRGLIAVWGKEAVQFLDGLITNSVKDLKDGGQVLAAFPNVQGRLLAVVRVRREGERFLFETEEATREAVFQNLFRFTFAGDFFAEDLSDRHCYFEVFGPKEDVYNPHASEKWPAIVAYELLHGAAYFLPSDQAVEFRTFLSDENGCRAISDELYETLRIEVGMPRYGVDMDETTVVPELGLDGLISYNKGCYIGQEIIARIHFRGHVAKQLTGVVADHQLFAGTELTIDGKNAGKIMSTAYSPAMDEDLALAFVRYDYLTPGTILKALEEDVTVTELPFF
jgi:folate-binding protein YgfZ